MPGLAGQSPDYRGVKIVTGAAVDDDPLALPVAGALGWLIEARRDGQLMSGARITDQQVRLYMSKRKHHSQEVAAAKAGISVL